MSTAPFRQADSRTIVLLGGRSIGVPYPITRIDVDSNDNLVMVRYHDPTLNRDVVSGVSIDAAGTRFTLVVKHQVEIGLCNNRRGLIIPTGLRVPFPDVVHQVFQFNDSFLVLFNVSAENRIPPSNTLLLSASGDLVWRARSFEDNFYANYRWAECDDFTIKLFTGAVGAEVDPGSGEVVRFYDFH